MQFVFLVLYIALIAGIAIWSSRRVKTLNQFVLGGRDMGPWLSAFAYATSYFSSVVFIGYAGSLGWKFGISVVLIGVGNALIGSFLAWKVLGEPTRKMTKELGAATMPELFAARYKSKGLKLLSAVVIFIFLTPYSASVYQGLGYLFEQAFGIPFAYCMVAMAVLTALYLLVGGYVATAWVDLVQGIFMLVGVGVMIFFVLRDMGGLSQALTTLGEMAPANATLPGPDVPGLLWLILLTSIGAWGLPQMAHKFYAVRDAKSIKTGTVVSTVFALLISGGAYFVGAFGRVALGNVPPVDAVTGLVNYDMVMPTMLMQAMPDLFLGLIVVLVLAASMSTLSSLVMTSASAIVIDLFKTAKPEMSDKTAKRWMQILCLAFVVISLFIAFNKDTPIYAMMSFSWGTVAGCCLGPYLFGVLWKRATKVGAWCGMLGGLLTSAVLSLALGTAHAPMSGVLSMAASLLLVPVGEWIWVLVQKAMGRTVLEIEKGQEPG